MKLHAYNFLRLVRQVDWSSTAAWAAEKVYLSPRIPTSEPGQWRASNVAAICAKGGPYESLDDSKVETVVICKGAQTAMTTSAYIWLAHMLDIDPSSALIVMNSTQDAREKSGETWKPLWEDSHKLQRFMPNDRRKCWTNLYQRINGSGVYWVGANSAGRLASKPIRRLVLDEEDKYPRQFGSTNKGKQSLAAGGQNPEAGAAQLAMQRVKAYRKKGQAKILRMSTPTDDQGGIWSAYQNGDKRHFYVRCNACNTEQVMVWQNFVIDMTLAKENPGAAVSGAHYKCPHCAAKWTDDQRYTAIDAGEWKPTSQALDPKCRSYWFPSWLSKFVTTGYLAAQWIQAQHTISGLQDFINSECGEAFIRYDNALRDDQFAQLEGEYKEKSKWIENQLYAEQYEQPIEAVTLGGVDVQKNYLVATFRQFTRNGDSGLVWHGTVDSLETLERIAGELVADWIFIDERYRSREIQEWAYMHSGYVPCQGVATRAKSLFSVNELDLDLGKRGQGMGRKITTISHDADALKDILSDIIQRRRKRWLVPKGYATNAEYCAQMSVERCINGRWVNPRNKANHAWDSEILCLLGAVWLGYFPVA